MILVIKIDSFPEEFHEARGQRACFEKRGESLFEDVEGHVFGRQGFWPLSPKPRGEGILEGVPLGQGEEVEEALGNEAQEDEESVGAELTLDSFLEILTGSGKALLGLNFPACSPLLSPRLHTGEPKAVGQST